jgi:hypothetical protein
METFLGENVLREGNFNFCRPKFFVCETGSVMQMQLFSVVGMTTVP